MASQQRLVNHQFASAESIVDTLRTGRLAQQLCALQILKSWSAPVDEIDPWQPETLQADKLEPLIQWVRKLPSTPETDKAVGPPMPGLDDDAIDALVTRYVLSTDAARPALLAELVHSGPSLLPLVRQRIAAQGDLSDSQHVALRELLYHALAGNKPDCEALGY